MDRFAWHIYGDRERAHAAPCNHCCCLLCYSRRRPHPAPTPTPSCLHADGNATSRHAQSHHFLSFLFKFPVQKKTGQCVSVTFHDLAAWTCTVTVVCMQIQACLRTLLETNACKWISFFLRRRLITMAMSVCHYIYMGVRSIICLTRNLLVGDDMMYL